MKVHYVQALSLAVRQEAVSQGKAQKPPPRTNRSFCVSESLDRERAASSA